jgi:hypothetical protein
VLREVARILLGVELYLHSYCSYRKWPVKRFVAATEPRDEDGVVAAGRRDRFYASRGAVTRTGAPAHRLRVVLTADG